MNPNIPSLYERIGGRETLAIRLRYFDTWMDLWEANYSCHLAPSEARGMSELAWMIGRRLQTIGAGAMQTEHQRPPGSSGV